MKESGTGSAAGGGRNWKFDYLKAIACITVVFLHSRLPGVLGDLVIYAFRYSVPIFFLITGYYLSGREDAWIVRKALRLLRLIVCSEAFYLGWLIVRECLLGGMPSGAWFAGLRIWRHPLRAVLCGGNFCGPLWYLYAAFWTDWLILLLRKTGLIRQGWLRACLIVLPLTFLVAGRYYVQNHFDIEEYHYLFGNALSFGLPMTLLGSELSDLTGREEVRRRLTLRATLGLLFFGGALIVLEFLLSGQYMDFHFSTFFVSLGLFSAAFTVPDRFFPLRGALSRIGREWSMWIYLVHYFWNSLLNTLAGRYGFAGSGAFLVVRPLAVLGLSMAAACAGAAISSMIAKSGKRAGG